ncbi:MAG: penicillin-binding transpeptidase domain-containing protein [Roseburia sp.]|nr:penicillin-binding transpeptidase domain-containing protein [Roseburia sp.]MCM1243039.1 penicillin-binding transpeptidase domain-containing protein [Roseburia sp.]
MVTSRLIVLVMVLLGLGGYLIYTIFQLQIVNGEEYADNFQLKITKERTIASTRGNIYAGNGELLAYNELAYSVTIEDVYESGRDKNKNLNNTIYQLIKLIEENGDHIINDFNIILDSSNNYQFNLEGTQLLRFLADVYGHALIEDLREEERSAAPDEVIEYLCGTSRYGIGDYEDEEDRDSFVEGLGYTKEEVLKILTIRYAMSANSFQKYIATTVANNVSQETVAVVMENEDILDGVDIAEGTIRKYNDSIYFAQILGYTGKVSNEELKILQEENPDYDLNDTVGKSGIEASMETLLQGTKGSETVYVDNVGKVIETRDRVEPVAGKDVWLTIDPELQKAAYHILEANIASILLDKIQNIKEYVPPENAGSNNIIIPIYDVYFACIDNNVIDTDHFSSRYAGETESEVWQAYLDKKARIFEELKLELTTECTPYNELPKEYQVYESFIVAMLYDDNVIMQDEVDKDDETYIAWTKEEVISLNEYLNYVIARNWVDVSRLDIVSQYSDSQEIYAKIISYIFEKLDLDKDFDKRIYRYMINNDELSGRQICSLLLEQDIVSVEEDELAQFERGSLTPYAFMRNRIEYLDITPAQLALEPYSGSIVITDVNTGDVLALVSYPSYDNNMMANGVDADYFASIQNDLSRPLLNYATQQRTAPGSTFKMVSATAGLVEGVIGLRDTITCTGTFDKITQPPRCWIAAGGGAHGSLNVTGGIQHSCNWFFYEVGYRLGIVGNSYNSEVGLNKLAKYADMYGLSEPSGVEIEEYEPQISDLDSVRSAIGQGTYNFTSVGLARYVTTVANSGTCYNLTLIDKISDHSGENVEENHAEVRNQIDMDASYWDAIHLGMRRVVEGKSYYSDLGVNVAGKTGTAQESTSHPNHALFVSYAPYEDPEIGVVVRVANGYSSDYAAQIAREVYKYYYGLADESEIITGTAGTLEGGSINGD